MTALETLPAAHGLPTPSAWPFPTLTPMKYGRILADPAWKYAMRSAKGYEKSPEKHYRTMPLPEMMQLPVSHLATDDCLLVMWSTWPHLDQAMRLMDVWGFKYKTGGAWVKRTKYGKPCFGTGYIFRSSTEPFLVGTIGKPTIYVKNQRNLIETEDWIETDDYSLIESHIDYLRREHSRKPPQMHTILERMRPEHFGAELFATEVISGYDAWGDQIGKFDDPFKSLKKVRDNDDETGKAGRVDRGRRMGAGGGGSNRPGRRRATGTDGAGQVGGLPIE